MHKSDESTRQQRTDRMRLKTTNPEASGKEPATIATSYTSHSPMPLAVFPLYSKAHNDFASSIRPETKLIAENNRLRTLLRLANNQQGRYQAAPLAERRTYKVGPWYRLAASRTTAVPLHILSEARSLPRTFSRSPFCHFVANSSDTVDGFTIKPSSANNLSETATSQFQFIKL